MVKPYMLLILLIWTACGSEPQVVSKDVSREAELITEEHYELYVPQKHSSLLILFPCFPCNAENTRVEFDIDELAAKAGVAVLRMNYNLRLWLQKEEKVEVSQLLTTIIRAHDLDTSNIVIGGFSGGGNVSLLVVDYLMSIESSIRPKGLFVVDSPVDLLALYEAAARTIAKDFSKPAVEEAKWIVDSFETEFGVGDSSIQNYKENSPYTSRTHSLYNLSHLEGVDVRFYSEPDTLWWQVNRHTAYEDMNACYIEQLTADLNGRYGDESIEYIATQGKGYRSNGDRHPHSWSIVDKKELIEWMTK